MSTLLIDFLGAILRWGITVFFTLLVDRHVLTPKDGDYFSMEFMKHVGMIAGMLITLAWSLWQKHGARIKFLTALQTAPGTSEAKVDALIANGQGATLEDGKK